MERLPVFVFHKGNPNYLPLVIAQAEKYNEVHLLGDESNKLVCKIWDRADDYVDEEYYQFEKIFVPMSDYSLEFDLNCFKRFFIMKNYMKRKNIERMIFADSDLLIYINFSEFYNTKNCSVSLSIPKRQDNFRWTAQAHCSLWSIKALEDFLTFVIDTYSNNLSILKEKYKYHLDNAIKGGVCDMTLLYLWSRDYTDVLNIASAIEGTAFDHCIGNSGNFYDKEYRFNKILQAKSVNFRNSIPYLYNTLSKSYIRANVLHCQGSAKALIPYLLVGKNKSVSIYFSRYREVIKRLLVRFKHK